jgi:hypothetical protein
MYLSKDQEQGLPALDARLHRQGRPAHLSS